MNYSPPKIHAIQVQNRDFIVSKLKTGDMIKVKSEILPIIYHYGIIEKRGEKTYIYHNQPDKINSKGGGLIIEDIKDFISGRDIISVQKTKMTSGDLSEMYDALKELKYDFVNFNCEHFINFASEKKYFSNQVFRWTAITAVALIGLYFLRKNK